MMILGHSELPPLPLSSREVHIRGEQVTPEILRLFIGCKLPWLDPAICRALAERGDWLQDMALRDDVQGAWWIGSAK